MTDEEKIREIVRRVVHRAVGVPLPSKPGRETVLVTENTLRDVAQGGDFSVPLGALVTPLARQVAMERKISLVEGGDATPDSAGGEPPSKEVESGMKTVAIGADHGGYELKELLKGQLREWGYTVIDCGTNSTESVDYPDFALAVAQLVAEGRISRGILVDGAGIGSCMAANKVPGVRAAMCYDEATAINSRAHNDANILTLGAAFITPKQCRKIVKSWLETPAGAGRHSRRVNKIMDIESRFLRRG